MKPQRIAVTCPRCGHAQQEPPAAYSTRCRKCGEHFRLEDVVRPAATRGADAGPRPAPRPAGRQVACFQCGTLLDVPPAAQSTMCKRCSSHVDLRDYDITQTVSKNFRTRGRFIIHETGCLLNTDTTVQDAILKGKVIGKIHAEGALEIHRTAEIKGSFKVGKLIIPADTVFRWPETIALRGTDILGELQANLVASGTVILRAGSRFFGDIEAASIVVEDGAVIEGRVRVGAPASPPVDNKPATTPPIALPGRKEKSSSNLPRLFEPPPAPPIARIR